MWWWQSQAPAGALSLAGSLPEEFGTCWAWLTPTKMRGAADAIATIEAFLMNVRRAIMFPSRLLCLEYNLRVVLWSLDILSRAFFNRPELTSRISRFAPDQLTQATGESKLPSLTKEGWPRHQEISPFP